MSEKELEYGTCQLLVSPMSLPDHIQISSVLTSLPAELLFIQVKSELIQHGIFLALCQRARCIIQWAAFYTAGAVLLPVCGGMGLGFLLLTWISL